MLESGLEMRIYRDSHIYEKNKNQFYCSSKRIFEIGAFGIFLVHIDSSIWAKFTAQLFHALLRITAMRIEGKKKRNQKQQ